MTSPKYLMDLSKEEFYAFLDSFDSVLTDLDETLWLCNTPLLGSVEVMNAFRAMGKRTYFVTNNSTSCREMLTKKMFKLGFHMSHGEIVNSSYMAAAYMRRLKLPDTATAYLIGSPGLEREFAAMKIPTIGLGPDYLTSDIFEHANNLHLDPNVAAVVVGFDQYLSLPKIMTAANYLENSHIHFIATNPDLGYWNGHVMIPGTGSLVEGLRACTGRDPVVVGKPEAFYCEEIITRWALVPERTLMIGDTAYTDIQLGKRCGFQTLLVLSGVTKLKQVHEWVENGTTVLVPDYYTETVGDMTKWILSTDVKVQE